ncbi:MAG TPA: DUF2723 domain-containing protein [Gemmatimonadales bacterium]|nr:DUF2723 domain-containing protein [Gemmatimonadales bacterium]
MSDKARRPPYLAALLVSAIVLLGYVVSLAPTVTFWDAGEFIAAAKILGIPHPPGTPLFVLLAHTWGAIFPFGEYAYRLNFMVAFVSALAAGFFFLVVHESLRAAARDLEPATARWLPLLGAAAAALIGAFTFTQWQNSNETEVYGVAVLTIAAICWLCLRWRVRRGAGEGTKLLLLIIYLAGLSIGNHLLALLVGPAVVAFLVATVRSEPAADPATRRFEWAKVAVIAGVWAFMIGVGLGNTTLMAIGGLCFVAAAAYAATAGALGFALLALAVALVGVTSYAYLYIRAGQSPMINEAQPDNFKALLDVIRRAQYPPRTPLDDPTVPHGPDNPGRSLSIILAQLHNYMMYFGWQWANGVKAAILAVPVRIIATVAFLALGVFGSMLQRRADRPAWWLLFVLFLVTGLGLVAYMNFRPSPSYGWDRWPTAEEHEVRERDYFFVVSFVVWGLWAGMGLAALARRAVVRWGRGGRPALAAVAVGALVPFAANFDAASRAHGPDTRLAADFAYNLLNSVPPYGILFTYGDNDTFPLWWAQEVEGIRRDVTVICLSLAFTDWYMRQMRDNPTRDFDEASAPAFWRGRNPVKPTWPVHTMTDREIAGMTGYVVLDRPTEVRFGPITHTYPARTVLGPNDIMVIRTLQQNIGRRPIAWAITAGRDFQGLQAYTVQQGLAFDLRTALPDTTGNDRLVPLFGSVVDVPTTERLAWEVYRYAGLLESDEPVASLDPTSRSMASTLGLVHTQLAYAYEARGDREGLFRNLQRAAKLSPDPAIASALDQLRLERLQGDTAVRGDTARGGP